jgi:hypothetical protein
MLSGVSGCSNAMLCVLPSLFVHLTNVESLCTVYIVSMRVTFDGSLCPISVVPGRTVFGKKPKNLVV